MGTSGTLMGSARYFHQHAPGVRVVGVEPRLGHKVQGLKNMKEAIVPDIYREETLDAKINIDDEPAFEMARQLAVMEGFLSACRAARRLPGR
jgi:cysteine synthase B